MDVNPASVLRTDWQPATEEEATMAAAARAGDQTAYLRALADVALVLPVTGAAAAGREAVTWATSVARGTRYVLAYTSISALPPGAAIVVRRSPAFDVAHAIVELGCGLAVDPGLPIQAFLTPDAVADLREWEPEWVPVDAALRVAVATEDRDGYLGALLNARLVLPLPADADGEPDAEPDELGSAQIGSTEIGPAGDYWTAVRSDRSRDPAAPVSRDVTDPEFPWWRTERVDGEPVILAFTSPARMRSELGDREWVEPSFIEVVAAWPDWSCALRLNPGGDAGMELAGAALNHMYDAFVEAMRERNPGDRDENGVRRG